VARRRRALHRHEPGHQAGLVHEVAEQDAVCKSGTELRSEDACPFVQRPYDERLTVAQKVQVLLVDDVDGSEASESISFGFEGTNYELDLSDKNAQKLRDELAWVKAARRTGDTRRPTKRSSNVDLKAPRAWAASNKIQLSNRGRVSERVMDQYKAAGN
jgi:hypothetical protein